MTINFLVVLFQKIPLFSEELITFAISFIWLSVSVIQEPYNNDDDFVLLLLLTRLSKRALRTLLPLAILLWGRFITFYNFVSYFITKKSPVGFSVYWVGFFEAVLTASVANCLTWSRRFWLYLPPRYLLTSLPKCLPIFLANGKDP